MTTTDPTTNPSCPACGRPLFLSTEQTNQLCVYCTHDQLRARQHAERERRLLGELHDATKTMLP